MANKLFTGKIKFYKQDKRYGFIIDDATLQDIFFHKIELVGDYIPRLEEKVQYEIGKYKDLKVAIKIQKIEKDVK